MKTIRIIVSTAMILGVFAGSSRASIIFTVGNVPQQPAEENVLLTGSTSIPGVNGSFSSLAGTTNQSKAPVLFTSTSDILTTQGQGQSQLQAAGGALSISNVTISVPGTTTLPFGTFTDLIINPMKPDVKNTNATITVNAYDQFGKAEAPSTFTYALGSGQNFLTITTANGETMKNVTISGAPFGVLDQVRISGAQLSSTLPPGGPGVQPGVPEPASLSLCAIGCAVMAGFTARRRKAAKLS